MKPLPLLPLTFLVGSILVAEPPIRDPQAPMEKLCSGFKFTEGAASDGEGGIYFTDIPNQRIMHWKDGQGCRVFLEDSGRANGLWVTADGHLLACEGGRRRVSRISIASREMRVVADTFEGKRFASPNDLWPDGQGGWYFTDPRYGPEDDLEIEGFHVYYLDADGQITRVIKDLVKPNGIMGDPDRKVLYVADNGDEKIFAYPIEGPGKLGAGRLFHTAACDGMTLDERGNLYLTTRSVVVIRPDGEKLDEFTPPEHPANVCFGGPEGNQLFITARTSLYRIQMKVRGGKGSGAGF